MIEVIRQDLSSEVDNKLTTHVFTDDQIPDDITINYSFKAGDANTLDGKDSSKFGDGHSLDADDGDPLDAVYVDSNGNMGIGTINPQVSLHNNGDFITKGPWLDVRAWNDIISAVQQNQNREITLLISAEEQVNMDLTVPENIALNFLRGGYLDIANDTTVTIKGTIEAGPYKIFDTSASGAKVDFSSGSVHEVYPEWWGVNATPGSDDQPAFQSAVDSGARIVRALPHHYYFGRPLVISKNPVRLLGSDMGSSTSNGTIIEANNNDILAFSGVGYDASSLILLDDGVDQVEICHMSLVGGTGSEKDQWVDYGIYSKGNPSHVGIYVHHIFVSWVAQWGIRMSCHSSTFQNVRVANSNGIWIGKHDVSSAFSANIILQNCFVIQNSQSNENTGYRTDSISGFTAIGCASEKLDLMWDNYYSIGTIVGSDGENCRKLLYQRGPDSNLEMVGCRWYNTGDSTTTPSTESLFKYKGRLALRNTQLHLYEGGAGEAYAYLFEEIKSDTPQTSQLIMEGLQVKLDGSDVDPIHDTTNCPNSFRSDSQHLHPELDPSALMTLDNYQSVPDGIETEVHFNKVVFDLQSNADPNSYKFDVTEASRGIYEFETQVTLAGSETGTTGIIRLYKDPSNPTLLGQAEGINSGITNLVLQLSIAHQENSSKSYYVTIQHYSGAERSVIFGENRTFFRMRRIAPIAGI